MQAAILSNVQVTSSLLTLAKIITTALYGNNMFFESRVKMHGLLINFSWPKILSIPRALKLTLKLQRNIVIFLSFLLAQIKILQVRKLPGNAH